MRGWRSERIKGEGRPDMAAGRKLQVLAITLALSHRERAFFAKSPMGNMAGEGGHRLPPPLPHSEARWVSGHGRPRP